MMVAIQNNNNNNNNNNNRNNDNERDSQDEHIYRHSGDIVKQGLCIIILNE